MATAGRVASHSTCSTLAEVTDSGGGEKDLPALIMLMIWLALVPASMWIQPAYATIVACSLIGLMGLTAYAVSVPWVEGTPTTRGSTCTASRVARANALNSASTMWCAFSP